MLHRRPEAVLAGGGFFAGSTLTTPKLTHTMGPLNNFVQGD